MNIDEHVEELKGDLEEAIAAVKQGGAEKASAGLAYDVGFYREVDLVCQRKGAPQQSRQVV